MEDEKKESQMSEEEKKLMSKDADEDAELGRMINSVAEANMKIDDDYDEKMKRLENKRRLKLNEKDEEEVNNKISLLKEKLNELISRISDARRKGKDPFIADLMLRNIKAKIKMAEVTNEKHDFDIVEEIIRNATKELEETLAEEQLDVKKEIQERLNEELSRKKADAAYEQKS